VELPPTVAALNLRACAGSTSHRKPPYLAAGDAVLSSGPRGGGPRCAPTISCTVVPSPRTWGWTERGVRHRHARLAVPTHGGVDRRTWSSMDCSGCRPRAREGEPGAGGWGRRPTKAVPTHVGVDLRWDATRAEFSPSPRTWGWAARDRGRPAHEPAVATHVVQMGVDRGQKLPLEATVAVLTQVGAWHQVSAGSRVPKGSSCVRPLAGLAAFLRDRFRDADPANVNATRLEIACAASLAAAGVPFGFGGQGPAGLRVHDGRRRRLP
jgi:hypothetical protein